MKLKKFEKKFKKKNMFRHMTSSDGHMTSYDGKLRHLPHLDVSTLDPFRSYLLKKSKQCAIIV